MRTWVLAASLVMAGVNFAAATFNFCTGRFVLGVVNVAAGLFVAANLAARTNGK